jgi:gliding motility-associated-like protein
MRLLSLFLLLTIGFLLPAHAQLLPIDQPEQDACHALQLCGNSFTTPYSYQGNGLVQDMQNTPCGGGEGNVVWLKLVVNTAGVLVFTITPANNTDDYDFAVVNGTNTTCDNLTSANVVRCNFNNNVPVSNNGVVGLNTTSTLTSVFSGTTGSNFLQQITAAVGDVYYIMINNFGQGGLPSSGFTINFAGSTASFVDNTPPHFAAISSTTSCTYKNTVTVHMNTPVACNSITATGSDFSLTPAGTIVSASGVNCSGLNGYTQDVVLNFAPSLNPATYTLHAATGTDNNTLLNLCGASVPLTESINFTVAANAAFASASLACNTLTINTNIPILCSSIAANASDFHITGPASVTATNAVGINCNAQGYTSTISVTLAAPIDSVADYTVTAQMGTDGNTLLDNCNTNLPVGNSTTFHAVAKPVLLLPANLTTCINTGVVLPLTIANQAPNVTYTYAWSPSGGLSDATIQQPVANPTSDVTYTVTVTGSDASICTSTATVAVHNLQGFDIVNNDTVICAGASVAITVAGSNEYTYNWTPTTNVSDPSIKNPTLTPATSTTYTLTASHAGCNDSAQLITINVQPNPDGIQLTPDVTAICRYGTVVLHAIAQPTTYNYTYIWSPAIGMLYSGGPNNAYQADSTIYIKVSASTPIGCKASDSFLLTVFPGDFLSVNAIDTGYCVDGSIQLQANGAVSYAWSPSEGLSAANIGNPIASPNTSTQYTVIGTDAHHCTDTALVNLNVYPAATLDMPDSVDMYHGEHYHLQPSTNTAYFTWFPPSGIDNVNISDPTFDPLVRTRYFVTATTTHGCSIKDSIDILVKETVIDIPNAFAPNGANNIFKPSKRGIVTLKSFNIYNRWGQKVFESANIDNGWDGTFNDKPQPMGVYVYTIEAVTDSGRTFTQQGNVTLLR